MGFIKAHKPNGSKCDDCRRPLADVAYIMLRLIRLCMSCAYEVKLDYDQAHEKRIKE